jgi:hypothetical protein
VYKALLMSIVCILINILLLMLFTTTPILSPQIVKNCPI